MSPDDIFAAQFWPWPDPAIKRDAQGRVMFVNAAFLALYGGRVEDWRGNAVGGWPAPQPASSPYRFETRLPGADGSEQVYDWMEQMLSDGNAFALARNVTNFIQSPEPDPATSIVPAMQTTEFLTQDSQAIAPAAEQISVQASDVVTAHSTQDEPAFQTNTLADAPLPEQASEPVLTPSFEMGVPDISVPDVPVPQIEIPSDEAYALTANTPAPVAEAPREFERRALPIEDDSAVLGNNWRDAVIAKAVGASDVAPEAAPVPDVQPPASTAPAAGHSGPIRILLAEDNAINALLTRTLLEAEGHTVETVEDGQLAVEAMKTASFDLIFMDMRMPNMDGLEATRKIRTLPNVGKNLPIIALTANAFDDDRNACFDSGMNDFMTKPVSAEELSEKVRDWTSPEAKARLGQAA